MAIFQTNSIKPLPRQKETLKLMIFGHQWQNAVCLDKPLTCIPARLFKKCLNPSWLENWKLSNPGLSPQIREIIDLMSLPPIQRLFYSWCSLIHESHCNILFLFSLLSGIKGNKLKNWTSHSMTYMQVFNIQSDLYLLSVKF